MRTSTSLVTLVAFMAVAGSAAPIHIVEPIDRVAAHAYTHQGTRSLVPEGKPNSVNDPTAHVESKTTSSDNSVSAVLDVGKVSPDTSNPTAKLPPVHANVDINDGPDEQPQQQEPPQQEPPKGQTPSQDPQPSQNQSQPPSSDPQPQTTGPDPHNDDESGTAMEVDVSNSEQTEDAIETANMAKDEAKGMVLGAHGMLVKAQNEATSVRGKLDHVDEGLDVGITAGASASANKASGSR
ncbi:hypothetical protein RhiJN_22220 [Ceratobasidium sp. AG-Ba]|nr:hypothetical protein RhiJN_22220 [Ceratobasidium sp. AG-Ba]